MSKHRLGWTVGFVTLVAFGGGMAARAEDRQLRPEVGLLMQSCGERLQEAAKELNLTADQQTRIKAIFESYKDKRQALRDQRKELIGNDLAAIQDILTPNQREKVKEFIEDKKEALTEGEGPMVWLRDQGLRETLCQKLQCAAEKLDLSADQQAKIRERVASSAEKYRSQRKARHELVESEFKGIEGVLTPDQRTEARRQIEHRMVTAAMAQSLCHRIHSAAEKLGLTPDQRRQILEIRESYQPKFEALADARRGLLQEELTAVNRVLTPEQREAVRDLSQDHMVIVRVDYTPEDPEKVPQLRETIRDRLEAVAAKLKLTDDQRREIKEQCENFRAKYGAQREERISHRQEELKAIANILTPEQKEKIKDYVTERRED